ncbi:protein kinase [Achlya hypogyna]|uniref:Protein kinase n=1 Tax=Achlya hypogyna TaxID=1202772 RepID=A0A1V9YIY1_ACHHY|nr:protein kinase [Achlya hypogyna]
MALEMTKFVAEGSYGHVWLGAYRGQPVAIKCLLPGKATNTTIAQLVEEIKLSSKMDSPYIARTLGASWRIPSELQMVLEWMDCGDLKSVLDATKPTCLGQDVATFPWSKKIESMLAIAEGLVYLHSLDIIHRDLKSRNVLLDSKKGTKLTDFGVSREISTATMTAPEILQDSNYTTAVDVYSFGVLLSELATHDTPYYNLRNEKDTAIISRVIQGTVQPAIPSESCPPWVRTLALACLTWASDFRPTAVQVAYTISQHMHQSS